jgi:outer membrane receptor protein involved in Fe transport
LSVAISTTLALAASGLSTAAYAQDAELEEVVVTGSRIAREDGFGAVAPVSIVNSDDIRATGFTRMEDVLNTLPSIEAGQSAFLSNGASGTASVDLRGLGPERTLVLFNGRRMQSGGIYSVTPDVNQVPAALVERVEVLTGGASATYGADAVAGVVNFITRRVNGVEVSLGGSGYYHQNGNNYIRGLMDDRGFDYVTGGELDGKAYNVDLVIGSDFADGKGNATAYATWRKSDPLLQGARDYAGCALNASGTACGGSGSAPIPNFITAPVVDGEADFGDIDYFTLASNNGLIPWTDNYYNYAPINYFMRPEERWSLGTFVDYEISEHFTPYMEVNYMGSRTKAQIAESGTFFFTLYQFPTDYELFPQAFRNSLAARYPGADEVAMYIGKRNVEGGPRYDSLDFDSYRIVGGLKGAINDNWDYDLYYLFGETRNSSTYMNDLLEDKITAAINPGCEDLPAGCYQVFTYGGVTPAQAAGLGAVGMINGKTSTEVISATASGDLGFGFSAGNILVAGGFEHRSEKFESISDELFETGVLLGQGGPQPSVTGGYNVSEWFAEANVPLLADVPFAQALSVDLAYRYSDYNTIGTTDTYRFGADWKPVDMFRIRAGYNRAVRAPNVTELFTPNSLGLWSGSDPCAGARPEYTAAQCANTGVTAAQYGNIGRSPAGQYNQIAGGDVNLDPEKADTITAGIVIDPMANLTISVDYWQIEIEDQIGTLGSRTILDQCATNGLLCDLINRGAGGSLWLQSGWVVNTTGNFGEQTWEGVDLAASWVLDALAGSFRTSLIGTYLLTRETTPIPEDKDTTYDCVGVISQSCYPAPEWRHSLGVSYDSNEWWSVGLKWRYIGSVDYDGTVDQIAQKNLSSAFNYFDVNATFRFLENSDVVVGINNIMDEEPPLLGSTVGNALGNANTVAGFYDTLGMFGFVNVTFRF